jgi:large subunit ribosomal protein L15
MSVIVLKKTGIKKHRRVGRGVGSGKGRYSGRGQKGQKARSGGNVHPRREGGQMPLYRRIPKRGFKNNEKIVFNVINVESLNDFKEGSDISVEILKKAGLVKSNRNPVKLLADGELKAKGLKVTIDACSETAKKKIEGMGGQVIIATKVKQAKKEK